MPAPTAPQVLLNDPSRGQRIVALYWVLTPISGIILILRLWARGIKKTRGFEDWLTLFCWLNLLGIAIMITLLNNINGFEHMDLIAPQQLPQVLKIEWATQPFGIVGLSPGKIAIAFTILRIQGSTESRAFRWSIYTSCFISIALGIPTLLLQFLQCKPTRALWTPNLPSKCINPSIEGNFGEIGGVYNAIFDFYLAILPSTFIFRLQISIRKKVLLILLLSLSLFTGIAASIKVKKLKELGARSDITWNLYGLGVWQGIEMFLVIVCGSIPFIKPLWDKYFEKKGNASTQGTHSVSTRQRTTKRLYQQQDSTQSAIEPALLPEYRTDINHEIYEMEGIGG